MDTQYLIDYNIFRVVGQLVLYWLFFFFFQRAPNTSSLVLLTVFECRYAPFRLKPCDLPYSAVIGCETEGQNT